MNKKRFIGIALFFLTLSLAWILLTPVLFPPASAESQTPAPHPGFLAPNFKLQTPAGEEISLDDYDGQPVLVFLWASWCSVCKATMPGLQEVYTDYQPRGFEVLAVNTTSQDSLSSALNYYQAQGYTYPMLLDRDGTAARDYQLYALPTAVLVGPDGFVQEVIIGSGLSAGFLRVELDALLGNED